MAKEDPDRTVKVMPLAALREQFAEPPDEYGPIDCWWWEAGKLDRDKMRFQLEDMKAKGVAGTWYYPRFVAGEPLSPDPPYWSEAWWELVQFTVEEHERLGLIYWFDDWTAHQFFQDEVRGEAAANPALVGRRLVMHERESSGPEVLEIEIPPREEILDAAAYRMVAQDGADGDPPQGAGHLGLDWDSRLDLNKAGSGDRLVFDAPEAGWVVAVVCSQQHDLDYLSRAVSDRWIDLLLGTYEQRIGRLMGTVVQAYGTDELTFLNGEILYSDGLARRFEVEKGYDPGPYLAGLFRDIGRVTDRIRCQYYEVMCSEIVDNLYRPFAQWTEQRGMSLVEFCPWGKEESMLRQTHHYGDFFRYMGNYTIPGNEENRLGSLKPRSFSAKMASSIAHLNGRSRVGVCAYWGSGWGHNTQTNLAWTHENYSYGVNLYNRHGALSHSLGGWYEWVPPAVHFRQPYWQYWRHFTDYVKRLSFILSQGTHRPDAAVLYPLATIHANWEDRKDFNAIAAHTSEATFELAKGMFRRGIDLDFVDDNFMARAEVSDDGLLRVSGIEFCAVVLPPLTTICLETLRKIAEFRNRGGTVVAVGRLPQASAQNGRDDPEVDALLSAIFDGEGSGRAGTGVFLQADEGQVARVLTEAIDRDVVASVEGIHHTHQRLDGGDVYFVSNARSESRRVALRFRLEGAPEIWDAATGAIRPVHRFEIDDGHTAVRLDMGPWEALVLVFGATTVRPQLVADDLDAIEAVEVTGEGIAVRGLVCEPGLKTVRVRHEGAAYAGEVEVDGPPEALDLDGEWRFRLEPTMDNRWGDFRYPAAEETIGAEARRFRYREEEGRDGAGLGWHEPSFDDADWEEATCSYGPYWWALEPVPDGQEVERDILARAQSAAIGTGEPWEVAGQQRQWKRYVFSQKHGAWDRVGGDVSTMSISKSCLTGLPSDFLYFDVVDDEVPGGTGQTAAEVDPEAGLAGPGGRVPVDPEAGLARPGGGDIDGAGAGETERAAQARYLLTWVHAPKDGDWFLDFGGTARVERRAWVNGAEVVAVRSEEADGREQVRLRQGRNTVLLKVLQPTGEEVSTYVVFCAGETPRLDPFVPELPWFGEEHPLRYDITPDRKQPVGWYRFTAPPGAEAMRLNLRAEGVSVWVDGRPTPVEDGIVILDPKLAQCSSIALRVKQNRGCYGGAVFALPVQFECGEGMLPAGDWCDYGLAMYSGGGVYARSTELTADQVKERVFLELGQVNAAAEARVNGQPAGVRMALPYRFDITDLVREGSNEIEVKVVNTMANHMSSYPTKYVFEGQTVSGLLGPVRVEFASQVELSAQRCAR